MTEITTPEISTPDVSPGAQLSPLDAANLIAGQAVAAATSYLDYRSDVAQLRRSADWMMAQTLAASIHGGDPQAAELLKIVRLLAEVCAGIVKADERQLRADGAGPNMRLAWCDTARQVVRLIRFKSWLLCGGDGPMPELDRIEAATSEAAAALKAAEREQLRAELAQLEAAQADAPEWGAAVGARYERINAIRRALAGDEPRG